MPANHRPESDQSVKAKNAKLAVMSLCSHGAMVIEGLLNYNLPKITYGSMGVIRSGTQLARQLPAPKRFFRRSTQKDDEAPEISLPNETYAQNGSYRNNTLTMRPLKTLLTLFAASTLCTEAFAQAPPLGNLSPLEECRLRAAEFEAKINSAPTPPEANATSMPKAKQKKSPVNNDAVKYEWEILPPAGDDTLTLYATSMFMTSPDKPTENVTVSQFYGPHMQSGPHMTELSGTTWTLTHQKNGAEKNFMLETFDGAQPRVIRIRKNGDSCNLVE